MISKIVGSLEGLMKLNRSTEALLIDLIAAVSPWAAPILPAYLTWYNLNRVLLFPAWVALVSAGVIEFVGLSSISTALMLWTWNESKREKDPAAPLWLAILSGVFYLAIVLSVNTLLEIDPKRFKILVQGLMSCLSIVAGLIIAVRGQHARRLQEREREKQERREERMLQRSESFRKVAESPENLQKDQGQPRIIRMESRDWRKLSPEERHRISTMSPGQIVEAFGVSERTAYNWMKQGGNHNGNGHHG